MMEQFKDIPNIAQLMEIQPFVRIFRQLVDEDPTALAVTCDNQTVTRGELDKASNRQARDYELKGVELGDFVTIALPNSVDFFVHLFACWKVGAVPQPVSYRLPLNERREIVDLADSKLIVGADAGTHPGRQCLPVSYEPNYELSDTPLEERVSPIFKAMTSGGSTGRPKLILAGTPAVGAAGMGLIFQLLPTDKLLLPGPLYHNAPLVVAIAGLLLGQHVVVMPKFDAAVALDLIKQHNITFLKVVPTMMSRMLKEYQADPERYDLSTVRILWHMAAPCADWLKAAWIDLLGAEKVWELYGGTESVAQTMIRGDEWLQHRGSVGRPVMGGQMKILDEEGNVAPAGEVGEIYMRGPEGAAPTYDYVGAEKKQKDGWESIGDLGWIDSDGYLFISDRRTDMINSGGANVYPAEVEAAIESHPSVRSCAVIGLPDDDLGQRVHAIVQANGLSTEELLTHVGNALVRYKVPRSVEFVDTPMRDDAGKVRRSAVRDAAIERMGLNRKAS